jgi:VNT family MFS transporter (synaptic vesicle glycoprotein 2)
MSSNLATVQGENTPFQSRPSSLVVRSLDNFLQDAEEEHADTSWSHHWRYWAIFASLGVANSSDASEILCLSYILSDNTFQHRMLLDTAWRGGLLAAAVFLGMLLGGLLVGTLGDRLGRRPMLLTGLVTNCTAGLLSAAAPDVLLLAVLRLVAGVGIGASVPPLFTLCSELAPPAYRGFWVTVAASFWMVGSIYVALVGWWLLGSTAASSDGSDWRIFAAMCALPSALGCFLVFQLVPESPRFLALQGRHDEAVVVAQRLADSLQYTGPPLTREELIVHYPYQHHEYQRSGTSASQQGNGAGRPTWIGSMIRMAWTDFKMGTSKLYTPQLRQITWPLQMVWFSLSFGSYGLLTWINTLFFQVHLENVYFNALLFSLSNLPGNLLSAWLMDRAGRSTLLIGSVVAAALSLIVFAFVAYTRDNAESSIDKLSAGWIVGSACAFQCFTISAWNAIDVMTSELFPTTVRSTGLGVCAASGRIGAMLAQFVNGALVEQPVRLLLVAAGTLLLGALTPGLLPAASDRTGQPVVDLIVEDSYEYSPVQSPRGALDLDEISNHVVSNTSQGSVGPDGH